MKQNVELRKWSTRMKKKANVSLAPQGFRTQLIKYGSFGIVGRVSRHPWASVFVELGLTLKNQLSDNVNWSEN